jgi:hypothetical protein
MLMKVPVPKVDEDVEHFNNYRGELDGLGICMGQERDVRNTKFWWGNPLGIVHLEYLEEVGDDMNVDLK